MTRDSAWDDRITRLVEIRVQERVLVEERRVLGAAFVTGLAVYERMLAEQDVPVETPPCGFRPEAHGMGSDIFWRFSSVSDDYAFFVHSCDEDHGNR